MPESLADALRLNQCYRRLFERVPRPRGTPPVPPQDICHAAFDRVAMQGGASTVGLREGTIRYDLWYMGAKGSLEPLGVFSMATEVGGILIARFGSFVALYSGRPRVVICGNPEAGVMYRDEAPFAYYDKSGPRGIWEPYVVRTRERRESIIGFRLGTLSYGGKEIRTYVPWVTLGFWKTARMVGSMASRGVMQLLGRRRRAEWWEECPKQYQRMCEADIPIPADKGGMRAALLLMVMTNMARVGIVNSVVGAG